MRILHTVQGYYPDFGGSEEAIRRVSEYLVSWGHDVTVATRRTRERTFRTLNGVTMEEFDCRGNIVEGIHGDADSYREFIRRGKFEVIMNYAAQTWASDLIFDILPSLSAKKVFVPCGYSRLHDPRFAAYFSAMPAVLRNYDRVVYLSPHYIDAEFGMQNGLRNGAVIPNGADLQEFEHATRGVFRRRYGAENEFVMVNVSNHSALKNHEFFWNCVQRLSRHNVRAFLIGNSYAASPKKWFAECYTRCRFNGLKNGVSVLENLPRHQVVEAFVDADVFVFGSRVECSPLVMFESFASRTLFVTTNCGNVEDYGDVACIVRNEDEAGEVVRDFQQHPEAYQPRIEKGYRLFLEKLNWEVIARQYESLYLSLLDR